MDISLRAENLEKRYGEDSAQHDALRGVSLVVAAGEFLAIRGPSGCGKSTLLHILGAMDQPTGGEVWLGEKQLDRLGRDALAQVRRRHIGFVFQAFNLLPTLNVRENVTLPLMLDGASESESARRADAALADVGMAERAHHRPSQLSGGEMQRVAIARALAIEPQLIIADEPTGSLDSSNGRRVLELLSELNESKKITVIMATHSDEASSYASRVLHMKDGKIDRDTSSDVVPAAV